MRNLLNYLDNEKFYVLELAAVARRECLKRCLMVF